MPPTHDTSDVSWSVTGFAVRLILLLAAVSPVSAQDVPVLKVGYIFTTHHTPLMVSAAKGDEFKATGVYMRPLISKEKYELIVDGRNVAILDLVSCRSYCGDVGSPGKNN